MTARADELLRVFFQVFPLTKLAVKILSCFPVNCIVSHGIGTSHVRHDLNQIDLQNKLLIKVIKNKFKNILCRY